MNHFKKAFFSLCLAGLLAGCAQPSEPLSLNEQSAVLQEDFRAIFAGQEQIDHPLTLYEAMARGILYNLNHRVAMMEGMIAKGEVNLALLDVLPSLNARAQYSKRDKENVVRAENANTGAQSVPPSLFEEEERASASLDVGFNVIDAGFAIIEAESLSDRSRIAEERRRKVVHNIVYDVRNAYWRAVSAQILGPKIDTLLKKAQRQVEELEVHKYKGKNKAAELAGHQQQMRLLEMMNALLSMKNQMATARLELSALINLPPGQEIKLAVEEADLFKKESLPSLALNMEDLEMVALMVRPEIREDILMQRVAARDIRATALGALPGVNALFGYEYDSNDFLTNNDWTEFSLSITQNLVRLFTLPTRMEQGRNKEKLVKMRRQALVVAILSQAHLARHNLNLAQERFSLAHKLASVSKNVSALSHEAGNASHADKIEADMHALLNRINLHMAYASYQNAYGRMLTTIGMDPLPPALPTSDIAALAGEIEKRTSRIHPRLFDRLVAAIKQRGLSLSHKTVES